MLIGYITERGYKQAEAMLLQAKAEADFLHRIMIISLTVRYHSMIAVRSHVLSLIFCFGGIGLGDLP